MFSVTQKLNTLFTDIANILRNKLKVNESIKVNDMPNIIINYLDNPFEKILNSTIQYIPSYYTKFCTEIKASTFQSQTSLLSVDFPNCTTIGNNAFYYCTSLTSINFPNCTTIGRQAFRNCFKLTSTFLSNCTAIYYGAFFQCLSLTSISLPNCRIIEASAFYGCTSLISLYLLGSSVCSLSTNAFDNTPIVNSSFTGFFGSIYVPSSLFSQYQYAENWRAYSSRFIGI